MKKRGKTRFIGIRISEKDYEALRRKAGKNGNLSEYCRNLFLQDADINATAQNESMRELTYQVRKIGININQAVARMNAGISFSDDGELLIQELKKVQQLFEQYQEG